MVCPRAEIAIIRFGDCALDVQSGELTTCHSRVHLQDQPLRILLRLLERPGGLVTRDELRRELWPADTFVDFEHGLNAAVKRLRDALGDSAEMPRFIETIPRRGYRFIAQVHSEEPTAAIDTPPVAPGRSAAARWIIGSAVVVLVVAAATTRQRSRPPSTPADVIVLADVDNRTNDPVLTGSLTHALAVKLSESHVLNVLSEQHVRETLRTMRRPDALLTPSLAEEVCQRVAAKATVSGTIAAVGNSYVISLSATSCTNGETLARDQGQSARKEDILATLDAMTTRLRQRLGESLPAITGANTRLERATTSSLEALKAFTEGDARFAAGAQHEAIPFYKRAIELDPDFAMAHAKLGVVFFNVTIPGGVQELTRAFELRDRLTERERFYVTAHYHRLARADLDASRPVYEVWKATYSRDAVPYNSLGLLYVRQGRFDRALAEFEGAVHVALPTGLNYSNLVDMYLHIGGTADAERVLADWERRVGRPIHYGRLLVAVQRRNLPAVDAAAAALRDDQDGIANADGERARAAALFGRMSRARELFAAATRNEGSDLAFDSAVLLLEEAIWDAELGDCSRARARVADRLVVEASKMNQGQLVRGLAAVALAACGDIRAAEKLNTGVNRPALLASVARARIELARERWEQVLGILTSSQMADLSGPLGYAYAGQSHGLVAAYLRGRAHLGRGRGREAAVEFQKILNHPGIAAFAPYHALAPLYLARAYAAAGDAMQARGAYEQFFSFWKDADLDIPLLRAARHEHAQLTARH